ncbi:3-dehydroquinate synthase [Calycomorphotria hydatis]|uniref:3-dehydroquinate synthase n=1 Tax=Calycomorphotria hydatis TaxID=2528027 RepID=A0A517T905_9PLAN|nr:3-dehydroquinate synthase [Calycomorphotria hydatis]QDT64864.1 3-dehydroquinate synthase [Calycomorphotria hydatis]
MTDIQFSVPFTHRLRMTKDIFGKDGDVLLDLLESSEGRVPRVQFWLDEDVAAANAGLESRLIEFMEENSDRLISGGNVQQIPGGETVKNDIHIIERMLKCINAADLDRRSYVVVIGGGAVLDAVGFAAAIAHRGIRLIRIPTTTLAQADSGVGVKNSVNLFEQKNWIGTFAVPWAVINDAAILNTLPDRDFVCGFSEAVKVSLLKDPEFFSQLEETAEQIRHRDMSVAGPVIRDSALWHLKHITQGGDPFEALEARPLDYGHWSAHKLEVMTNFELRHGEAVGIGVAIDTVYSALAHQLPMTDADRVLNCLSNLGIPLSHPMLSETGLLFEGLEQFRQHLGGRLTVTMLDGIGKPINVHEIDRQLMQQAIEIVSECSAAQVSNKTAK